MLIESSTAEGGMPIKLGPPNLLYMSLRCKALVELHQLAHLRFDGLKGGLKNVAVFFRETLWVLSPGALGWQGKTLNLSQEATQTGNDLTCTRCF